MCAILAANASIIVLLVKNYGRIQYLKGKSCGFEECSNMNKKMLKKLKEELDARTKIAKAIKRDGIQSKSGPERGSGSDA